MTLAVWAGTAALALSACVGATSAEPAPTPDRASTASPSTTPDTAQPAESVNAATPGPREDVPSALDDPADAELPTPLVDPERIIDGGPEPDGIPPIMNPVFGPVSDAFYLFPHDPVVLLEHRGETRVYPVQILIWHEIVNDVVGGELVTVTYCPLCNTAIAFRGEAAGRNLTFGTSGKLFQSALVMYDRQTESLWSQVDRRAIAGHLTGTRLETVPVSMVPWEEILRDRPDAQVLTRETGFIRDYGMNPYYRYDTEEWQLLDAKPDDRLPIKERVVVVLDTDRAVRLAELAEVRVATVSIDGRPVALFAAPGLASALDDQAIASGRRIPATGVFAPVADGRPLTLQSAPGPGGVVAKDVETGSGWTLLGEAVTGPLAGTRLERIPHIDTFWFAAKAFQPDLVVVPLE